MEFTFTLRYQLSGVDVDADALVERLGDAGCDDATVGVGQPGRLVLDFIREAESANDAMLSALRDVHRAEPAARLIEASPDLVGLTDVADLVGVSRQNMRKLMLSHDATFPLPVHAGSTMLWHLADVLEWMKMKGGYDLTPAVLEIARTAWRVNAVMQARRATPTLPSRREFAGLV